MRVPVGWWFGCWCCWISRSCMVIRRTMALSRSRPSSRCRIAVIGGGASGIFAAIHAATAAAATEVSTASSSSDSRKKAPLRPAAVSVTVFEAGRQTLSKVQISGGGRCNVLHDIRKDVSTLLQGYPRGHRELRGVLTKHYPVTAAAAWFVQHGVNLKTEPDGRMFPVTDSSYTVMRALLDAAQNAGVDIRMQTKVEAITVRREQEPDEIDTASSSSSTSFGVTYTEKSNTAPSSTPPQKQPLEQHFDAVILATGSAPAGYALAKQLLSAPSSNNNDNQTNSKNTKKNDWFVDPVPSLFTLSTKLDVRQDEGLLYGLSGVSVPNARVSYQLSELPVPASSSSSSASLEIPSLDSSSPSSNPTSKKRKKIPWLTQEGPLLITHVGLTGPAALRLSAFAAREMAARRYRGRLRVHWAPQIVGGGDTAEELFALLWDTTRGEHPQRAVASVCPWTTTTSSTNTGSDYNEEDAVLHFYEDETYSRKKDTRTTTTTTTTDENSVPHRRDATAGQQPTTKAVIPKRLWSRLVTITAGVDPTLTWGMASKDALRRVAVAVAECPFTMTGKGTFKQEFVTAGGVALNAMDMKTMQSKTCPGLFVCGELLNVDGVTGGYNFANCWSTGYVAGTSAAAFVREQKMKMTKRQEQGTQSSRDA